MQLSLLDISDRPRASGAHGPTIDPGLRGLRRYELGRGAWVDHLPRWVVGQQQLFDALAAGLDWRSSQRPMYERIVDVPRLLARVPDGAGHPVVGLLSSTLTAHYRRPLRGLSAAWYRDGRDSVAPHGDRVAHREDALVCTVSLGQPRLFQLRPVGGGPGLDLHLGWGDLVVMGGTTQQTWLHGIPKASSAGPRIALMLREAPETGD